MTTTKKTWKESRTVRLMVLSATQIETFDLCRRKWWLERIRKLPVPSTKSQAFGTVLHAVIERYLRADNLGRTPDGNPVDLYPAGWTQARSRYDGKVEGTMNEFEADTIKSLVTKAMEAGILERPAGGYEVESEFREDVQFRSCPKCEGRKYIYCSLCQGTDVVGGSDCPNLITGDAAEQADGFGADFGALHTFGGKITCPTCGGDGKGDHIQITGFIDLMDREGVQDHKSTSRMAYAKSKEKLKKTIQMLLYAAIHHKKYSNPLISLRHNVFCKDPTDLRVRKTETSVSADDVIDFWTGLKTTTTDMSDIRRQAETWSDIPDPKNMSEACNAYGGCPFRSICTGQEDEKGYEARMSMYVEMGNQPINSMAATVVAAGNSYQKDQPMGLEEIMAERSRIAAAASGTAPIAQVAPITQVSPPVNHTPPVTPQPVAPPATSVMPPVVAHTTGITSGPPWARAGCPACKGLGFATSGSPCRICDSTAKFATPPRPQSSDYNLTPMEAGMVYFERQNNPAENGVVPMKHDTPPVKAENFVAPPVPVPVPVASPVEMPVPTQAPITPPVAIPVAPAATPTIPATTAVETRGRKRKSFTLLINAVVSRGDGKRLLDTFRDLQKKLSDAAGKPYYDMDAFRRRDEMAKEAEAIAEAMGSDLVTADLTNGSPDFKSFVESIRPFAGVEIVGCSL